MYEVIQFLETERFRAFSITFRVGLEGVPDKNLFPMLVPWWGRDKYEFSTSSTKAYNSLVKAYNSLVTSTTLNSIVLVHIHQLSGRVVSPLHHHQRHSIHLASWHYF